MAIYNLTRKEDIWWKDIKKVKGKKERNVTWKTFKKLFKRMCCQNNIMNKKKNNFMN